MVELIGSDNATKQAEKSVLSLSRARESQYQFDLQPTTPKDAL